MQVMFYSEKEKGMQLYYTESNVKLIELDINENSLFALYA